MVTNVKVSRSWSYLELSTSSTFDAIIFAQQVSRLRDNHICLFIFTFAISSFYASFTRLGGDPCMLETVAHGQRSTHDGTAQRL